MTAEEKIALLTERLNDLEEKYISLKGYLGVDDTNALKSINQTKLAYYLQKKPLLTRHEVAVSLGIGLTTLDKWSQPLTEEEEKRGDRVYLPPVKSGGRTYYYLADLKQAFRKQRGDVEGFRTVEELERNGGFLEADELDEVMRMMGESILRIRGNEEQ